MQAGQTGSVKLSSGADARAGTIGGMRRIDVEVGKTYLVTTPVFNQIRTATLGPLAITVRECRTTEAWGTIHAVTSRGWDGDSRLVIADFEKCFVSYRSLTEVPRGSITEDQQALVTLDAWISRLKLPIVLKPVSDESADISLTVTARDLADLARRLDLPAFRPGTTP